MTELWEALFCWLARRDVARAERLIERIVREERIRNRRMLNRWIKEQP